MVDVHGPGGTDHPADLRPAGRRGGLGHPGHRGQRDRPGRPGGHLGPQLRRVGGGRPGRGGGRGPAGAPQHPVQGGRGGLHPAPVGGPDALHRRGIPRERLPGAAGRGGGRRGARCPTSSGWWSCAPGDGAPGPATAKGDPVVDWEVFLQEGGACSADVAAGRTASITAGRPLRPGVHLGDHRPAQGGDDHPRPDPAHLRHLVRGGRAAAGRPLPDRQSLLPHLRLQGRASWPA